MVTIRIQNPTKGPLITVTSDDTDASDISKAFVIGLAPGVKILKDIAMEARLPTASPLGTSFFAMVAPYIVPLICSGDTPPNPDAVPETSAVPLPDDVTPTVAPRVLQLLDDLVAQVAASDVLDGDQKTHLNGLLKKVRVGHLDVDAVLEVIWKVLMDDLLRRAESLGAKVQRVVQEERCYSRIQYDPANAELNRLFAPLLHVLLAFQLKVPNSPPLVEDAKLLTTIYLPTWKTLMNLYTPYMVAFTLVGRKLDVEEQLSLLQANRAPIQIAIDHLKQWLSDLDVNVHPLIFMMYEMYHALSTRRFSPEKEVVLDMLKRLMTTESQYAEYLLTRMVSLAVRLSSPMTDEQVADALWEVLEFDLAFRAMKLGAKVEISDDGITISVDADDHVIADLMNPILRAMHAIRKRESTVIRVNQSGKIRTFNLVRWSAFKPKFSLHHRIHWEDYVDSLRQDVGDLKSSIDAGHPLANAWETIGSSR